MSNLKAEFELKPSAEYKKTAREAGKIVYKGDKFIRYISLCDFAAIIIGMVLSRFCASNFTSTTLAACSKITVMKARRSCPILRG